MKVQQGYSYHIKDEFFDLVKDKYLMSNKEGGNYRPHFYAVQDKKNVDLFWMIPISSQAEKYKGIIEKKIEKYGKCNTIVIGRFAGKENAFLIQNAFPIIEKYLDHVHTIQGRPISVHKELNKILIKNLQDVLAMYDSGVKLVFTNIQEIRHIMEQELERSQRKKQSHFGRKDMDLSKLYIEEDLFPREITTWEERDYGFLFYNEENKDSFDSNHAIIFREKIADLKQVLNDITEFYKEKGIRPSIYQSISEEGYFVESQKELLDCGFECWTEEQKYMVLCERNTITPNTDVDVQKVCEWKEEYGTEIFVKAGEPWEIDVAKRTLLNSNTLFFVAFYKGKPVGMTHCHITDGVCRVDYLLVSKEFRNIGVGRALINSFVEYCNANEIDTCYLWPDGETAEKIYYEAGFRYVETRQAGRATYNENLIENTRLNCYIC